MRFYHLELKNSKFADIEFAIDRKYPSKTDLFLDIEKTFGITEGIHDMREISIVEYRFSEFKLERV